MNRSLIAAAILALAVALPALRATSAPAAEPARAAAEKGVSFLLKEDVRWRGIKDICASCHQGAMSVFAYAEARKRGLTVGDAVFADTVAWTKARFVPPYDTAPVVDDGMNIPSLSMPLLTMAQEVEPEVLSARDLDRIAKNLLARQQADGGWQLQPRNPSPVLDNRESFTTWMYFALESALPAEKEPAAAIRAAQEKARAWLDSRPAIDSTQSAVLQVLLTVRDDKDKRRERAIEALLKRQKPDGGWGQTPELAGDAYATGQALYALNLAGFKSKRKEVQRGVEFLISTQQPDGTWKMIPRETPERQASKNLNPITYFGTAWGVIGLVRSLPAPM